jgi:hypothetical protein
VRSSVSIYLPTTRASLGANADRTALANLARSAADQLTNGGTDPDDIAAIRDEITDLVDDDEFWTRQADSLAVFVTPDSIRTFRLANQLTETLEVSDRFHVKPLFRAVTFPHAAYVLALAKGEVRLLEIGPSGPTEEVPVADLPRDAWDPRGNRVFKAREGTYVRKIDHALRAVLNGSDLPLIIAATETIAALYRTVNTYPHLVEGRWPGNPEEMSDIELAAAVRPMLDQHHEAEISELHDLFAQRESQSRSATELADIAQAASRGAVDTVLVDIDANVPGSIDSQGVITFADSNSSASYGVIDEIARRVFLTGGRVLAVRSADIPQGGPAAAILRYQMS